MNTNEKTKLEESLNLVDFGPCKDSGRPQDWISVAGPMCKHCVGSEDVNLAAARIIAKAYRDSRAMLERCELWLSTAPEGRKMQLECQRILMEIDAKP